eukprot:3179874-Prymnesium_polylepis.1
MQSSAWQERQRGGAREPPVGTGHKACGSQSKASSRWGLVTRACCATKMKSTSESPGSMVGIMANWPA